MKPLHVFMLQVWSNFYMEGLVKTCKQLFTSLGLVEHTTQS